jgi:anti-anti-sigma factor
LHVELVRDERSRTTRVVVSGEVDLGSVPVLGRALETAAERGGTVVLDLAGATRFDDRGTEPVVRTAQRLIAAEGSLVVANARPSVRRGLIGCSLGHVLADGPGPT